MQAVAAARNGSSATTSEQSNAEIHPIELIIVKIYSPATSIFFHFCVRTA